jgi:prepilin-type N-terminal cleavage/methylation domain-containing protein
MKSLSNEDAFSLTEMLVVMVLISIATALSYPMVQSKSASSELFELQNSVVQMLNVARNKALLTGTDEEVNVDLDQQTFVGWDGSLISFSNEIAVSTYAAKSETPQRKPRFTFFGSGGNSGGRIVMGHKAPEKSELTDKIEIRLNWFSGNIELVTE